jgi:hypothetical protein
MDSFVERNDGLRRECLDFITKTLSDNGNKYEFVEEEFIQSEDFDDVKYDLPVATYLGKHDYTYYYAITSITLDNGNLWFNGICIGEDSDEYNFVQAELETGTLCDVADMVKDLFKTYKIN